MGTEKPRSAVPEYVRSFCRQIEGKVVEISRLQEIFAEKVLQQVSRQLSFSVQTRVYLWTNDRLAVPTGSRDRWYSSAGGWCYRKCQRRQRGHTGGNILHHSAIILKVYLRDVTHLFFFHHKAIKNNAGFRVWILFFLVMCSFSLLFLDWYDS